MKKKIIFGISIIFISIFLLFISNEPSLENYTNFSFSIEDTEEQINGEVFFDNFSMGNTKKGILEVLKLNSTPEEIMFRGKYNEYSFEVYYDFPADYLDYDEYVFSLTLEEIRDSNDYLEYIDFMEQDNFSGLPGLHWGHMPLTYKFNEENPCGITRKNRILYAFDEIKNATNGTVSFVEGGNYDILINCIVKSKDTYYEDGYRYTTLAEGGVDYYWGNIIINATTYFYPLSSTGGYYPSTEIHEILHCFNFEHTNKSCMLMSPFIEEGCKQITSIDQEVINKLIQDYQN